MNRKIKQFSIAFILMIIAYVGIGVLDMFFEMDMFIPHVGLLFVFGLILGPYGALGAVVGNMLMDGLGGFTPTEIFFSAVISFGVSFLAYKLWYGGYKDHEVSTVQLDNIYHLSLF